MEVTQPYESSKVKRGSTNRAQSKKSKVTLPLDDEIVDWFMQQAAQHGGHYQTAINDALLEHIIREELHRAS